MGWWTPGQNAYARAQGDSPPASLPGVRLETELPNDFVLQQLGMRTETMDVAPLNRGEFTTLSKGDFESSFKTISDPNGTYQILVTSRDLGAGEAGRQTVYIDDGSDPGQAFTSYDPGLETSLASLDPIGGTSESSTSIIADPISAPETIEYVAPPAEALPAEVAPADASDVIYVDTSAPVYDAQQAAFNDYIAALEVIETDPYGGR